MKSAFAILSVVFTAIAACGPTGVASLPAGLTFEQHALAAPPEAETLSFQPVDGSMQTILSLHEAERAKTVPVTTSLIDGHMSMQAALGTDTLIASEIAGQGVGWVTLRRDGQEIYRIDTGQLSPLNSLRGLWVYEGHWMLETADFGGDTFSGRLTRDCEILKDGSGPLEAFDFQLMRGRPFYFFQKNGKLGFSYDGTEVIAGYDEIPHYGCCSASALNPRDFENMVSFFARRGATWYYVEVGAFN
jgi:hypothetical protein